eukprot:3093284-Pyramimonas_sp.AAC.1
MLGKLDETTDEVIDAKIQLDELQSEVNKAGGGSPAPPPLQQQQAAEDPWGDLPELSEQDLELLDPDAKTKYAHAAALARQAKEVYSAAKDHSTSIKEVADTLKELQAK